MTMVLVQLNHFYFLFYISYLALFFLFDNEKMFVQDYSAVYKKAAKR
jgi:hypothetical protein